MTTESEIREIFGRLAHEAIEAHRVATIGPFNPYGDGSLDTLVWTGTIRECWENEQWPSLQDEVNERREEDGLESLGWDCDWKSNAAEIEATAARLADSVIGSGRPICVAFCDGTFPSVYCESATSIEIEQDAAGFFGSADA